MSDIRSSNPSLPLALIVMRHGRREDSVNPEWQIQARYPFDTPLADTESEIDAAAKRLIEAGRKFDGALCCKVPIIDVGKRHYSSYFIISI